MHKFEMKSKHPINKSTNQINNPPPTSGEWTPPPSNLSTFQANPKKKKKKIDPATEGGHDPPQRPRGEIRPPSVAIFISPVNQKKKKRYRSRPLGVAVIHPQRLGVAAIHPNGQGERDPATPSGYFCLSDEPKKNPVSLKNRF
jgi:hypothetical protein